MSSSGPTRSKRPPVSSRGARPATSQVVAFIDAHKNDRTDGLKWGIEPICKVLQFAPSTYYAARDRAPSKRDLRDAELIPEIRRVSVENFGVYGQEKLWRQLNREGIDVGRDEVARLMRQLGLVGTRRGKTCRTTTADTASTPTGRPRRSPLRRRGAQPAVGGRSHLRVDQSGVLLRGVRHRRLLPHDRGLEGLHLPGADLALDALEMGIWRRRGDVTGLVHHSDRGVQYLAIRYTERLAEAGAVSSVGSKGDSYDNALAETVNGLYKTEIIYRYGPWSGVNDVELHTARWVEWWNARRLHSACNMVPPAEFEDAYYRQQEEADPAA